MIYAISPIPFRQIKNRHHRKGDTGLYKTKAQAKPSLMNHFRRHFSAPAGTASHLFIQLDEALQVLVASLGNLLALLEQGICPFRELAGES